MNTSENASSPVRLESVRSILSNFRRSDWLYSTGIVFVASSLVFNTINLIDEPEEPLAQIGTGFSGIGTIGYATLLGLSIRSIKRQSSEAAKDDGISNEESEDFYEPEQFSARPDFTGFSYTDENGIEHSSPFTVMVTGLFDEYLETGRITGGFRFHDEDMDLTPVVEIQDPQTKHGSVELTGAECQWTPLTPSLLNFVANENYLKLVVPAGEYLQMIQLSD